MKSPAAEPAIFPRALFSISSQDIPSDGNFSRRDPSSFRNGHSGPHPPRVSLRAAKNRRSFSNRGCFPEDGDQWRVGIDQGGHHPRGFDGTLQQALMCITLSYACQVNSTSDRGYNLPRRRGGHRERCAGWRIGVDAGSFRLQARRFRL
jgi:hypothetical protein